MKKGFNLVYQKNWINSGHRMHHGDTPKYVSSFMEKLFIAVVVTAVVLYLCK